MRINSNNGHTLKGLGSGAIGLVNESVCNRQIGKHFVDGMRSLGHTVFDCSIEQSTNYLTEAVREANKNKVDYAITHHLNCSSDVRANGVEVWIYDLGDKETLKVAKRICEELSKLGLRNRGVKESKNFYWLRKTSSKAMIIEYLFCSNKEDVEIYNPQKLANSVILALTNKLPSSQVSEKKYKDGNYDCFGRILKTVDVKEQRSSTSKSIGKLTEGLKIEVDYCLNNWFSVWENGNVGYIDGKYVELIK